MRRSLPLGRTRSKQPPVDTMKEEKKEIIVEAGRIAEMELDRECILERSRLVSVAPARMPYISLFGRYNKRWYVDVVSLPHNSIRCLMSQVFALITAIHRLALDMTEPDFEKVFFLIDEFAGYARVILEAEEKLLYPEVESYLKRITKTDSNHALAPSNRNSRKEQITNWLTALRKDNLNGCDNVSLINSLQERLDEASRHLLDYFSVKESVLPPLVAKSIRGSKEKTRMESRLIKHFASHGQEFHYAALLTLPLNSEQVRQDFEGRHFSKATKPLYRFAVENINSSLKGITLAFEQAAAKYEGRFSMAAFLQNYGKDREPDATTQVV